MKFFRKAPAAKAPAGEILEARLFSEAEIREILKRHGIIPTGFDRPFARRLVLSQNGRDIMVPVWAFDSQAAFVALRDACHGRNIERLAVAIVSQEDRIVVAWSENRGPLVRN